MNPADWSNPFHTLVRRMPSLIGGYCPSPGTSSSAASGGPVGRRLWSSAPLVVAYRPTFEEVISRERQGCLSVCRSVPRITTSGAPLPTIIRMNNWSSCPEGLLTDNDNDLWTTISWQCVVWQVPIGEFTENVRILKILAWIVCRYRKPELLKRFYLPLPTYRLLT